MRIIKAYKPTVTMKRIETDQATNLVTSLAFARVQLTRVKVTREGCIVHLRDLEKGGKLSVGRGDDLPAAIEDGWRAVENRRRVLPAATLVALDGLMNRI